MKRKLLVATLFVVLVCLMIPVVANAATHTLVNGESLDLSTIAADDEVIIQDGCTVTLSGTAPSGVEVTMGSVTRLTLDNVVINNTTSGQGAIKCITPTYCYITLVGDNELQGTSMPGIEIGATTRLHIDGTGSLDVQGGNNSAGIGSDIGNDIGEIVINGGDITATGGPGGAGIGTGANATSEVAIWINGGTIHAKGGNHGAGIGGGRSTTSGLIVITGGTVYAKGGNDGAGIGGGQFGSFGIVEIRGGEVYASAGGSTGVVQDIGYGAGTTLGNALIIESAASVFLEHEQAGSFAVQAPAPDYVTYASSADVPASCSVPAGWLFPIGMVGTAPADPPAPEPAPVASTPTPEKVDNPQTGYGESLSYYWMALMAIIVIASLVVVRKKITTR